MLKMKPGAIIAGVALAAVSLVPVGSLRGHAQEPNPMAQQAPPDDNKITKESEGVYLYRVKVVQRDLDAVNYLHRSGSTQIAFKGTPLLPMAKGEAKVTSERGGITIDARFQGLPPANSFGREYLTYVLWAITPDGRPNNLGEILPAGDKNNITVTTALQSFGLVVTAEPYFSVTQPSDLVVLENQIIQDKTTGVLEKVNAHYMLLPRGTYAETAGQNSVLNPITRDEKMPLELYEANNALRIAQQAGADKYAKEIYSEAILDLKNATDILSAKKRDTKMGITYARQAVQRAEDARLVTLRRQAAERQHNAELARQKAQLEAQQAQLQAQQSALAAERARAAQAQADADRARAEAAAAQAQAQAAEAKKSADSAQQARERLRSQLNSVLATSETARGLIVNMSDVLFATGKYALKPSTQISLAKVAGILQSYPGLKLQVEGYTDNTGSEQFNQKLSENRAGAVRDFLVSQGVSPDNIVATGYGMAKPVADNNTSKGRALNRRVQLVVSGAAIGVEQKGPDAEVAPAPAPPPPPSSQYRGTANPQQ
ncbi:OmpA family protein [Edaphobacter sp. 12200R-103]|jgi:outer membrane protein OmpA-like peptidoglycan-associated protein|uniref:OmpA family protein n=1 Tax=Edaphobacter sp. 12200R-103 TaxID=2703788 RepID=UPI001EE3DD0E|nr:OmpA family protein [Edaphobacter sp. 12200R-103]